MKELKRVQLIIFESISLYLLIESEDNFNTPTIQKFDESNINSGFLKKYGG